ncbi:hypothetical protein [Psychroserpens luteolus]|uniref:hypothetical protein n=1 Tax=Psychroserpens luteolus TaxID=2855840 RepID=UPI001E5A0455|nr:hypothetical protein [Psychroserpens luteolus]MCD2259119.1 hypothetical protein [Psychroserpens luteolus]
MKVIYLIILSLFICSCNSQENFYEIDKSIENDLKVNKEADEMSKFGTGNLSYFIFSNSKMEKMTDENEQSDFDFKKMIDTTNTLLRNVCHCQLKNDTIKISGGIFYGGGIGYQMKMTKNEFNGQIVLASDSKTYKKTKDGEFIKELYLASEHQDIRFYEKPEFKIDSILKGKIILTSENYYTKSSDGLEKDQTIMKILFECKLSEYGGF